MNIVTPGKLNIAVVGSGISGLSAAWLLSQSHNVTLYEKDDRAGGHSNTVDAGQTPVDTGFIVYNTRCYPNLCALFDHLGVETTPTDMSFAASMDEGGLEYGGGDLSALFAQKRNLFRPRFWKMVRLSISALAITCATMAIPNPLLMTICFRWGQPSGQHRSIP